MNEYKISDYGIFDEAVSTVKSANNSVSECKSSCEDAKSIISNESVFMGEIAQSCVSAFPKAMQGFSTLSSNFSSITSHLRSTCSSYKSGDASSSQLVTSVGENGDTSIQKCDIKPLSGGTSSTGSSFDSKNPVSSVDIPDSVNQSGYSVTCYGEGGWYLGGGSKATGVASGTNQKSVHNAWLEDGARYKDGIAVLNVDGEDHYLIATAPKLGTVGDNVNVKLANGQTIPCVIADQKNTGDRNFTEYGHSNGSGQVNVLEFEVDRDKFNSSGNPKTDTWGLEWDSSSPVSSVDNYGSII